MRKPKPLLCGTDDVLAILEGRTRQHRIIINPQPIDNVEVDGNLFSGDHSVYVRVDGHPDWRENFTRQVCRYESGDILMVKENFRILTDFDAPSNGLVTIEYKVNRPGSNDAIHIFNRNELHPDVLKGLVKISKKPNRWQFGSLLPNDLTRIFLRITEVKLQRMQEISTDEAILQGYRQFRSGAKSLYLAGLDWKAWKDGAIPWYRDMVNSRHGCDTWNRNPWVFAISFEMKDNYAFNEKP